MIYEFPEQDEPIRQGDIFNPLPLTITSLDKLPILTEDQEFIESDWLNVCGQEAIIAQLPVKSAWGIVATQDCDAIRAPIISFFQILEFGQVTGLTLPITPKKWVSMITMKSRLNARWFYLPSDNAIGFENRMAINFHFTFQVPREDLEKHSGQLRKGRLNEVSYQHYRESIARYFRRYPYDEWYPLTKEEFAEYDREKGSVAPFDWQK